MAIADIISRNLTSIREDIRRVCVQAGRDAQSIRIIAVTKTQNPEVLEILRGYGITDFGENRMEHLLEMQGASRPGDTWHFIGRIQSRQLAGIADRCSIVHSLGDEAHIRKLAHASQLLGRHVQVFLQVNVSGEATKAGVEPISVARMVELARAAGGLHLVGLMTMAPDVRTGTNPDDIRSCFIRLRELAKVSGLQRLSMGMSGDFRMAIEEGATDIRIGSALFQP